MSADEIKAAPPEYRALQDAMLGRDRVPRRAVFDDLRVGQWVAVCEGTGLTGGQVTSLTGATAQLSGGEFATEGQCARGEVTILLDEPAPPVIVRREDYDRLSRVLQDGDNREIVRFARALIDHADTQEP